GPPSERWGILRQPSRQHEVDGEVHVVPGHDAIGNRKARRAAAHLWRGPLRKLLAPLPGTFQFTRYQDRVVVLHGYPELLGLIDQLEPGAPERLRLSLGCRSAREDAKGLDRG